jgi:histidinol dehydrogenase
VEIRTRGRGSSGIERAAKKIIEGVRRGGDEALVEFEKRLDGATVPLDRLRVSRLELDAAPGQVEPDLARAIRFSMRRIRRVQGEILRRLKVSSSSGGFMVEIAPRPLQSVGCYVPGGRASYASSVLMTAGVARLAGVKRVIICTPPGADGRVGSGILAAAKMVGVDEVYAVGGAQAIAAMAYGTESVRPVRKIVGPGGRYVVAAKRLVSSEVETDFEAGPTELVVLADEACEPRTAAWELIGQAEHGKDSLCGLVTYSAGYADRVRSEIRKILPGVERREHVEGCLERGFAAICESESVACSFLDALAPEHLEIMTGRPRRAASMVTGAGLKLLGRYSPCAASDYAVGTDHVIPTQGFSAMRGCLSVLDFVKLDWTTTGSREGLRKLLGTIESFANAEGLPNHYLSANSRFEEGSI